MKVVAYEERFGEIRFPEGFEKTLGSLTIEQQMEHYRTTCYSLYSSTNWSERTNKGSAIRIQKDSDVTALIVKDWIIVGVMMLDDCNREVPCLAEERVCTYYASDNNGAGYKERIEYTYLICIPENFEQGE